MLGHHHVVREVADEIAGAIRRAVEALREGRVEQEPAMTDRMIGAIEETLRDFKARGVQWGAKTLTDRGPGSQESKCGADFMGVLNISLPDFSVTKGFLAQAKLIRNGSAGDVNELKRQCDKMLNLTPASFVFLYSRDDVWVVPAISVIGANVDPVGLYGRSAKRFFEEHLECFIGDRNISSPTPMALDDLRRRFDARSAILLEAHPAGDQPGGAG